MLSPLAALIACTLLIGTVASLWERLPWVLSQRLGFPEAQCRDWQSWFSFPLIMLFPLLGHLIDAWDGRYVLFIGILGLAMSLAWLGQVRGVRSAVFAIVLLCVAIVFITLPTLAILPQTFLPPRLLFPGSEATTPVLFRKPLVPNLAFIGVVLGLACTPGMVGLILKRFEVHKGFLLLALLCLVPALMVSLTPSDSFQRWDPPPAAGVLHSGICWMLAAVAFVWCLLAELFRLWKEAYLQQSSQDVPWVRGVAWLAMLLGLIVAGWAVWYRFEAWGLAALALIYAVIVGNMAGEFTSRAGPVSLWLAGASFVPILPTLLTIPIRAFHDTPAGTMGFVLGGAALGNFLMQPMLQRFVQRNSVVASMWLSTILSLVLGALAVPLAIMLAIAAHSR